MRRSTLTTTKWSTPWVSYPLMTSWDCLRSRANYWTNLSLRKSITFLKEAPRYLGVMTPNNRESNLTEIRLRNTASALFGNQSSSSSRMMTTVSTNRKLNNLGLATHHSYRSPSYKTTERPRARSVHWLKACDHVSPASRSMTTSRKLLHCSRMAAFSR